MLFIDPDGNENTIYLILAGKFDRKKAEEVMNKANAMFEKLGLHPAIGLIGIWLLIKFLLLLLFGRSVIGLLLSSLSQHSIQDNLTFFPFVDWFIMCFLFVLMSDYLSYQITKQLITPGNFMRRMLTISLLDIPVIALAVIVLIAYSNFRPYQSIEASYFVTHFFILLLVALKNVIAVIVLQKRL